MVEQLLVGHASLATVAGKPVRHLDKNNTRKNCIRIGKQLDGLNYRTLIGLNKQTQLNLCARARVWSNARAMRVSGVTALTFPQPTMKTRPIKKKCINIPFTANGQIHIEENAISCYTLLFDSTSTGSTTKNRMYI